MSSNCKFNALLLAAGLGTRMRPITNDIPKPLIKICNHPLLEYILCNITGAGIERIAMNTHYLPGKIGEYLSTSPFAEQVALYHEEDILGTGGPAVNAKSLLSEHENFLLHNGDILTDAPIGEMLKFHTDHDNVVTMLTLDGPENKLKVMENGAIVDILGKTGDKQPGGTMLTYGGIMVLSRKIFDFMPSDPCNCSIIPPVIEAIKNYPGKVMAFRPKNIYWNDLGTIDRYYQAHKDIISERKVILPGISEITGNRLVAEFADINEGSVSGFICAGANVIVEADAHVQNCILLEGTEIKSGEFHGAEVIGPGFSVHRDITKLKQLKILEDVDMDRCEVGSLIEFGSSRGFYRLRDNDGSRILMISDSRDEDFGRFTGIGRFLAEHHLMTPEIYRYEDSEYTVLMEDLGNYLLYDFRQDCGDDNEKLYDQYAAVVDALAVFQLEITALIASGEGPEVRIFNRDYLRWETAYFQKQFLQRLCGIREEKCHELDDEFERLASEVFNHPKVFMHRDFQSQNIMIHDGKVRFVDFQGARIGPVGYDVMSLLRDPYVDIPDDVCERLLQRYFSRFIESPLNRFVKSEDAFRKYVVLAGLQRNMQALGAYGFLSQEKGKLQYLKYITQAVIYLRKYLDDLAGLADCNISLDGLTSVWPIIEKTAEKYK